MPTGQRRQGRATRLILFLVPIVAALFPAPGCAVRLRGVIEAPEGTARLRLLDGHSLRLIAAGPAAGLGSLDGSWVEITGQRTLGTVRVAWWTVTEGPHGFPAYVGVLQPFGSQLGLEDRASGATLLLDDAAVAALWPERGRLVVLEGYIDGPHRLHVTWSKVVEDARTEAR
ncbi:MAG: hypothetical protein H0V89_06520 [Deltaproteobacteria bacterium]|nr:hypothetical protein [Deltaproteobacteria bacterium]